MITTLIQPTMDKSAHAFAALSVSSSADRSETTPSNRKNWNSIDTSRLSLHSHQVPQLTLPQIEPVANVIKENQAPKAAAFLATMSASFIFQTSVIVPATAISGKKAREVPATATWTTNILEV